MLKQHCPAVTSRWYVTEITWRSTT